MLKRNLLANYLGQGWRAIMALAFVPLYIRYLGIEAFGLIGMFAVLQTSLGLLDVGMKPALGREMARYRGGAHNEQSICDLLRSVEIVSTAVVIAVAITIWSISGLLATEWVQAQILPTEVVAQAFTLMGVVASLQFLESIYVSSLAGLQRQVVQNVITSSMATLRGFGAVVVLVWISPTTQAFFIWQGVCSAIGVIALRVVVYKSLPAPPRPACFSIVALLSIWRFAFGMVAITLLALLLTQVDKILLSRMLTLEMFGYYALAGTVAGSLVLLVGPITAAYYPRFNELVVKRDETALRAAYHQSAQLVTVVVGSAATVLFFFAEQILFLWTGDQELAHRVAPIMAVLTLGTFLNCLMWVPYQMQLAHGWTSLAIWINVVAVLILIPAIIVVVPAYGPIAAAWIWVVLNAGYCVIGVQFMYRRILTTEKWKWYVWDVIIPISAAVATSFLVKLLTPELLARPWGLGLMASTAVLVTFTTALTSTVLRQYIGKLLAVRTL